MTTLLAFCVSRLYQYDKATGTFNPADNDYVNEVLDTKAYIDMPNQPYFTLTVPCGMELELAFKEGDKKHATTNESI